MAKEPKQWYDYLNPWNYISPTGKLNPWAIQGADENVGILGKLMPNFSEPKSLILPGLIIGGLLFCFLIIKK